MSSSEGSKEVEGAPTTDRWDEFEKFRSEVSKVISELRKEIEDLKSAISDLRISLSEIENPFNLLVALAGEEGGKKLAELMQREGKEKERVEERKERKLKSVEKPVPPPPPMGREVVKTSFDTSIALIKWVWTLLDLGFDVEDVKRLSSYCEFFGLLPKGSSHFIHEVASAVNKARALNLSEELLALSIYGAAKASGVTIELEDITDVVFNALRKMAIRPELPPLRSGR